MIYVLAFRARIGILCAHYLYYVIELTPSPWDSGSRIESTPSPWDSGSRIDTFVVVTFEVQATVEASVPVDGALVMEFNGINKVGSVVF